MVGVAVMVGRRGATGGGPGGLPVLSDPFDMVGGYLAAGRSRWFASVTCLFALIEF